MINTKSKYKKKYLDPVSHLEECEFITYSIQLSIYRHILENTANIPISKSTLLWLNPRSNENYVAMETPYLQSEIKALFGDFLKKKEEKQAEYVCDEE